MSHKTLANVPFIGRAIAAFSITASMVLAPGVALLTPLPAHAVASVVINSINGQPPGHCLAGALTVVVSGMTGSQQGGPYSVVVGNGFSTSSPVSVGTKNTAFNNVAIVYTPTGAGTNLYVNLYHGSPTGNDSHIIVVNQCIPLPTQGVLKVVKHVASGSALASAFSLHVKQSNADVAGSPAAGSETGTDYQLLPGTYVVSEDALANYSQTSLVCRNVTDNVTLGGASVALVAGKNYTCTITNDFSAPTTGVLHVVKHVINDEPAQYTTGTAVAGDFSLHVKNGANAEVSGSPQVGSESGTDYTLAGASYKVTETGGPAAYTATYSGDCDANGNVTVVNGVTKTCTITNNDQPTNGILRVVKHVVTDNGGTAVAGDFSLHVKNGANAEVSGSPQAGSESGTNYTLAGAAYAVSETGGPSGYTATYSGDCDGAGNVTLANGTTKTCTITNDDQSPVLTVTKVVTNSYRGTSVISDFSLFVNSITQVFSGIPHLFNAGSLSVSETGPAGYNAAFSGDCDASGNVALLVGESKTCTITNTDKQPGVLHVVKHVINDEAEGYAGTASASDFTMSVTGGNPAPSSFAGNESGTDVTIDAGASYSVGESGPTASYGASYSAGCSGTMAEAGDVTCTITNNDNSPTTGGLTVVKVVVNNNGATAQASDFPLFVNGNGVTNGANNQFDAGDYAVSETGDPAHYTSSFSGDCDGSGNVSVVNGQSKTCTITNSDIPPSLTLVKQVVNNNGGTAEAADWTLSAVGDVSSISGPSGVASDATFQAGTYTLSESNGPSGYSASNWSCEGAENVGNQVTMTIGRGVICTIVNDDLPLADVSVEKSVDDASPDVNQVITYTIVVSNAGPAPATGVTVHDALPSGVTYISDDGADAYNHESGIWTVGALANGESKTLHIVVTVNSGQQTGTVIVNDASVSYSDEGVSDPNDENDSDSASVTVGVDGDVCSNIEGIQTEAPAGQQVEGNGECHNIPSGGGGGGGGGGGNGPLILGGGGGGLVLGASTQGLVLGESCGLYVNQHLRAGSSKNKKDQVTRLQQFLNKYGFGTFTPTGTFGPLTEAAVKAFQAKYADNVLKPWNLSAATGLAYLTTIRQVNLIECPELTIQLPSLIPWGKNPSAQ